MILLLRHGMDISTEIFVSSWIKVDCPLQSVTLKDRGLRAFSSFGGQIGKVVEHHTVSLPFGCNLLLTTNVDLVDDFVSA